MPLPRTPSTRKQPQADNPPPPPDVMLHNLDYDTNTDTEPRSRPPRAAKSKALEIFLQARQQNALPDDAREIPIRQFSNVQLRIARSTIENAGTGLFLLQGPHPDGLARAEEDIHLPFLPLAFEVIDEERIYHNSNNNITNNNCHNNRCLRTEEDIHLEFLLLEPEEPCDEWVLPTV